VHLADVPEGAVGVIVALGCGAFRYAHAAFFKAARLAPVVLGAIEAGDRHGALVAVGAVRVGIALGRWGDGQAFAGARAAPAEFAVESGRAVGVVEATFRDVGYADAFGYVARQHVAIVTVTFFPDAGAGKSPLTHETFVAVRIVKAPFRLRFLLAMPHRHTLSEARCELVALGFAAVNYALLVLSAIPVAVAHRVRLDVLNAHAVAHQRAPHFFLIAVGGGQAVAVEHRTVFAFIAFQVVGADTLGVRVGVGVRVGIAVPLA